MTAPELHFLPRSKRHDEPRNAPIFNPHRFHDPELLRAARAVITERVRQGVATPPERLVVTALDEMPLEEDPAAVRAWAPSSAFRDAVRSVVLATLDHYTRIVDVLADQADHDDDDNGEPMH